jgi:hypothetical protein
VTGPNRDSYLVFLDRRKIGSSYGGKGGANRTDYDGKVAALVLEGHTTVSAEDYLRGQQGDVMHPLLAGRLANRESRDDCGSPQFLAAVQARVRASHPSLHNFNLNSIFSPAKEASKRSLKEASKRSLMTERQVITASKTGREALAKEKSPCTLNDFKLRTWTVSCLLSDLWYVKKNSTNKRTARVVVTEQDRD